MIEPNFGEGQLQQCVNSEITSRVLHANGIWAHPVIITLPEELDLGWDTGYYFPWIGVSASASNQGCNFFIQYKLSILLEGHRGAQFGNWGEAYFRFKIPHSTKENGSYVDDYHQWEAMKAVADDGYPSFYATNHVLTRTELFAIASRQRLIDEIPWLDISPITERHKFITFTAVSPHFILHSEAEEVQKLGGDGFLGRLRQAEKRTLDQDNARTSRLLFSALGDIEGAAILRDTYQSMEGVTDVDPVVVSWRRFAIIRTAYQRFFGAHLFRYAPAIAKPWPTGRALA